MQAAFTLEYDQLKRSWLNTPAADGDAQRHLLREVGLTARGLEQRVRIEQAELASALPRHILRTRGV